MGAENLSGDLDDFVEEGLKAQNVIKPEETFVVNVKEDTENVVETFSFIGEDIQENQALNEVDAVSAYGFICNRCEFTCSSKANLHRHKKTVHEKLRYDCDQCDAVLKRKDHLKHHILTVHDGVRYSCEFCSYSVTNPQMLKKHLTKAH